MKLYYSPGACSLSPHIVLNEIGLKYEKEKVDLKNHKTEKGEDFYAINPKGYVPLLVVDGEKISEGIAINLYLARKNPTANLAPTDGSLEYFRMVEWLVFISTELHKSFSPLFGDFENSVKEFYRKKLAKRFKYVSSQLGGRQYLLGQYSLADIYLFVVLGWARKMKIDLSEAQNLNEYYERIALRPAVVKTFKEEGLS